MPWKFQFFQVCDCKMQFTSSDFLLRLLSRFSDIRVKDLVSHGWFSYVTRFNLFDLLRSEIRVGRDTNSA